MTKLSSPEVLQETAQRILEEIRIERKKAVGYQAEVKHHGTRRR